MGAAGSALNDGKLSKQEMERIKRRFERQTGKSGRMSLMDFESILEFSGRPHIDHIFKFADRDNDGYISVPDFVAAMEDLGRLYSDEEKIRVAFEMYDEDGDGHLSLEDLQRIMHPVANGDSNIQVEMAAASLLNEYDLDRDRHLSYSEFRQLAVNSSGKPGAFMD